MAWHLRFWRRLKIAPGVTVNLSRAWPPSVSIGPRGNKTTIGRRGIRRSIGIPGTGLYATNQQSWESLRGETATPGRPAIKSPQDDGGRPALPPPSEPVPVPSAIETCGFCGGSIGADGRCEMCGQPAERWHTQ